MPGNSVLCGNEEFETRYTVEAYEAIQHKATNLDICKR